VNCAVSQWLLDHAAEICVPCLRLRGWQQDDPQLLDFVLALRYVENLEIVLVGNDVLVFDNIKRMVKDNVSLYKVSAKKQDKYWYWTPRNLHISRPTDEVLIPATTTEETALLDAYGQRNEFLLPLLKAAAAAEAAQDSSNAVAVAEAAQDSSKSVAVADTAAWDSSETDWFSSCVPSLVALGLAMPPRDTWNTFFAGMLIVDANQNDSLAHAPEEKSSGSTGKL
jgi:hypothetical protein